MVNNYNNGKIYYIICNTTGLRYYGSTCGPLNVRLYKHRYDYKGFIGLGNVTRNYRSSAEILINDNYEIILFKDYPCETRKQLQDEEKKVMNDESLLFSVVNINGIKK
jgi:hypothetical protein